MVDLVHPIARVSAAGGANVEGYQMKHLGIFTAAFSAAATFAGASAFAATLSLTNVTGTWSDVTGTPVDLTGQGTNSISWGTPFYSANDPKSGYDFEGQSNNAIAIDTNFILGVFTHNNNPIASGGSITGAKLTLSFAMAFDSNPSQIIKTVFDFSHWETNNNESTCANGAANHQGVNIDGCADRVTASANPGLSEEFTYGDMIYTLNLSGFLYNGQIFTEFWTQEEAANSALLVANFSVRQAPPPSAVPLPAAGGLLGAALVGMGLAARKRRKA